MPVRIRLQRQGKKGQPFYHIVVADGRAPRNGKFIEKLGTYNPMTNPVTIDLNIDKSVQWMRNGAQPSDTVRNILSIKGAMLKHHLLRGVDKGAMTAEQAENKFVAWVSEKESKIQKTIQSKDIKSREDAKERLAAEAKVKEAKAAVVAAKKAEVEAAAKAAQAPVAEVTVETEVATPVVEVPTEEAPVAEAPTEEAPAAE